MRAPAFESTFRAWCVGAGVIHETICYARPGTGGDTRGHRLTPPGEVRAGLLVVHGAGNDAFFSLTGIFAALLDAGVEIFTFDLDGHGRGGTTVLRTDSAREAVPSALEAWGGPPGGAPIHGLGISLGGALLLNSLPGLASTLASATLVCAPLRIRLSARTVVNEVGLSLIRTVVRERRWFGVAGLLPSFGPFGRQLYPLRLADPPGPGPFGYVPVINRLLEELDLIDAARHTSIPVAVVHGGRDRLVPVEQARATAAALPRSRLVVLPRETHLTAPLAPDTLRLLLTRTAPARDQGTAP